MWGVRNYNDFLKLKNKIKLAFLSFDTRELVGGALPSNMKLPFSSDLEESANMINEAHLLR